MQDANWNVVALSDPEGVVQRRYVYLPYGEPDALEADFTNGDDELRWTRRFASYEFEGVARLYFVRHRWYDARLGSWISRDPIGFSADDESLYRYAKSVPNSTVDPMGLLLTYPDGTVIFIPEGPPEWWGEGAGNKFQPGYVIGNDGRRIPALKNLTDDARYDTNCHGVTFAGGDLWIQNDAVQHILDGDGYPLSPAPKVGDIVLYYDDKGVIHSAKIVEIVGDVFYVLSQSGLATETIKIRADIAFPRAHRMRGFSPVANKVYVPPLKLEDVARSRQCGGVKAPCATTSRRDLLDPTRGRPRMPDIDWKPPNYFWADESQ